jgi:predicted NUDIX family NTP pyrophosphohydrolase
MAKTSAGLLPYRWRDGGLDVFLVHPGGPYWARKDTHAWSVAKGEVEGDEDLLAAARREFREETGLTLSGRPLPLAPVRQPGGKVVHVFALEADPDPAAVRSNTFRMEWPPRSGRIADFPEVDKAAWFPLADALSRIHKGQVPVLTALSDRLGAADAAREPPG